MITEEMTDAMPERLAVFLKNFDLARSRRERNGFVVPNPTRDDRNPSVRVTVSADRILIKDRTGAPADEILDSIGLAWRDLFAQGDEEKAEFAAYLDELSGGASDVTAGECHEVEGADLIHRALSAAVEFLALDDGHADYLKARGLPRDKAVALGYRSLSWSGRVRLTRHLEGVFHGLLATIPGWFQGKAKIEMLKFVGLLAPVRDRQGRVVMFKVRQFDALPRWAMLCGGGGRVMPALPHLPLGTPESCDKAGVTEGVVKADVAALTFGYPFVGVPGVGNWRVAVPYLKRLKVNTAVIAFDRFDDGDTSAAASESREATRALAYSLKDIGIVAKEITWGRA